MATTGETKYFVVGKDVEPRHLRRVEDPAKFAADGEKVLAIRLSDGSWHLVKFDAPATDGSNWIVKDGILHLHAQRREPLRSYREWAYYEARPYKAPPKAKPIRAVKPGNR